MTHVPPYRRPVNTVFQSYALFNHLSVWDNIAFGLRLKRLSAPEIQSRVEQAPAGQNGSVAIAFQPICPVGSNKGGIGASAGESPAVVLLDEPLGALDLKLQGNAGRAIKFA